MRRFWMGLATALAGGVLGGCGEGAGAPPPAAGPDGGDADAPPGPSCEDPRLQDLSVYLVVVDGLDPGEVGPEMPELSALRARGVWYEQARGVLSSSTIPNHAAMMTGVVPQQSGIVDNYILGEDGEARLQDRPADFQVEHLFTRLERALPCVHTASVLSVGWLFRLFAADEAAGQLGADFAWEPSPTLPEPAGYAPDEATMDAFLAWLDAHAEGPHLGFVNLADVDGGGHIDAGFGQTTRRAGLAKADAQIGRLVERLESSGRFATSVLLVLSDHRMDYSPLSNAVSLTQALEAPPSPYRAGVDFTIVLNHGVDAVHVADKGAVADLAARVAAVPGVGHVLTDATNPSLADYGMAHARRGDIVALAAPGYRFSEPSLHENPLPGNHGHGTTQHTVLLVAGGHPLLAPPASVPGDAPLPTPPQGLPGSLAVAPTVAGLFRLAAPPGGYDGPPLVEAFLPGTFE